MNFHTGGLLGEYEVEGCNGTSPTLVMERDQTYTMIQVCKPNFALLNLVMGGDKTYTMLWALDFQPVRKGSN